MTKINVLVAGQEGQVARALAVAAPGGGIRVFCMGRPELDIRDAGSIAGAFETVQPGIVINAAAYTAVDQAETDQAAAFAVNAEGAGRLAQEAAVRGIPILHLSTDYVFDGQKACPYLESDPVAPLGAYGLSKLEGERAVTTANGQAVIFRTSWVYSPFGRNFAKTMLRVAESRDELGVVNDQFGNPTSAEDIADALWRVVKQYADDTSSLRPGVFHMTASGEASWADFAEEIFKVSAAAGGPVARVKRITTAEYPTPSRRPANSRLDCASLSATYGIVLPDWRDSTHRVVSELIRTKGWNA